MNVSGDPSILALAKAASSAPPITEDSAALAFARKYAGRFLYDHDAGAWFSWSGYYWQSERTRLAYEWARCLVRALTEGAAVKVQAISRKTSFVGGVEKFASVDRTFAIESSAWNTDPLLLATPAGTIDLRTGDLRPADPADKINQITAVGPAERADCPGWLAFLEEATGADYPLIDFLQRWCGYCLSGDIREHALVFVYGPGGTGKTTFLNVMSGILNDYAKTAAMETFVVNRFFASHPTELAMLRGARLVTASETEEGRIWAESRIKQLTGGDPVTARFMRQDFFTYQPTYKLMIACNHEPALARVDDATRRRFNIIPFIRKPEKTDKALLEKLRPEWPEILRWMIDGCLAWQRDGLMPRKPYASQQRPISTTRICSRSGSRRNATFVQATQASATRRRIFSLHGQGLPWPPATSRARGSLSRGCSSGAGLRLTGSMGACAPGAASGFGTEAEDAG